MNESWSDFERYVFGKLEGIEECVDMVGLISIRCNYYV